MNGIFNFRKHIKSQTMKNTIFGLLSWLHFDTTNSELKYKYNEHTHNKTYKRLLNLAKINEEKNKNGKSLK